MAPLTPEEREELFEGFIAYLEEKGYCPEERRVFLAQLHAAFTYVQTTIRVGRYISAAILGLIALLAAVLYLIDIMGWRPK